MELSVKNSMCNTKIMCTCTIGRGEGGGKKREGGREGEEEGGRIEGEKEERERKEEGEVHVVRHSMHTCIYLPTNGLRVSEESRKAHSRPMRCSLPLSCSTIANTSDVSSSQAMCGYLGKK